MYPTFYEEFFNVIYNSPLISIKSRQKNPKIDYLLGIAEAASNSATCDRHKVGAVITINNDRIIATGKNGTPRGKEHCTDIMEAAKQLSEFNNVPVNLDELHRIIRYHETHAEINAINQMEDLFSKMSPKIISSDLLEELGYGYVENPFISLFVTHLPCNNCIDAIVSANIKHLYFKHFWSNDLTDIIPRLERLEKHNINVTCIIG